MDREETEHRVTNRNKMNTVKDYWPRILVNTFLTMPIIVMQQEKLLVVIGTDVLDSMMKDRWLSAVEEALDCLKLMMMIEMENVVQVDDVMD